MLEEQRKKFVWVMWSAHVPKGQRRKCLERLKVKDPVIKVQRRMFYVVQEPYNGTALSTQRKTPSKSERRGRQAASRDERGFRRDFSHVSGE